MFSTHSISISEETHVRYRMVVSVGTTKDQLVDSKLYREIVKKHKVVHKRRFLLGDIIEVLCEDGSFYAELLIIGSSNEEIFAKINFFTDHKDASQEVISIKTDDSYKVEWKGPKSKFAILREDGTELKKGFSSKEEANDFLQKQLIS